MTPRLKAALKRRDEANDRVALILRTSYPLKGIICYWKSGKAGKRCKVVGVVLDHADDRLLVCNRTTNKAYWINATQIAGPCK